ncbi:hypothetical protein PFISCL1PPCAC_21336 [Pristionchus fissidentatus]|uniref:RRM domain-containing protein n=1 Tax=Pristionchus fissidentatus TaxID=1538716 RepID=A0AAV5WJR7_9BILA|nr:hypothetical protein PFISCL1PPCAC_21336 [Pristionchus fissidentatus]
MTSAADPALSFKQNLQSSLSIIQKNTRDVSSPWEYLLNRMGAVLGAVVETNFGSASHSRITDLYRTIADVTSSLVDSSSSIALLHFARAFTVVLEESLRQLHQLRSCSTAVARAESSVTSPPHTSGPTVSSTGTVPPRAVTSWTELTSTMSCPVVQQNLKPAAAATSPVYRTPPHTAAATNAGAYPRRDYSPDATKGAVVVLGLPASTTRPQLITLLCRIGTVIELRWPIFDSSKGNHFAVCKYESDEVANRAKLVLTGERLHGNRVFLLRATYWMKDEDPNLVMRPSEEKEEIEVIDSDDDSVD